MDLAHEQEAQIDALDAELVELLDLDREFVRAGAADVELGGEEERRPGHGRGPGEQHDAPTRHAPQLCETALAVAAIAIDAGRCGYTPLRSIADSTSGARRAPHATEGGRPFEKSCARERCSSTEHSALLPETNPPAAPPSAFPIVPETKQAVVVRFAGDSGDGMQLTGDRFTQETADFGNDLSTLPNFPAEIRAPAGTLLFPALTSHSIRRRRTTVCSDGLAASATAISVRTSSPVNASVGTPAWLRLRPAISTPIRATWSTRSIRPAPTFCAAIEETAAELRMSLTDASSGVRTVNRKLGGSRRPAVSTA